MTKKRATRVVLATGLIGIMGLTACTDVNAPTNNPNQRATEGAVLGALTGALFGAKSNKGSGKDKRRAALLGGVVGGVAGGLVGNQLDKQAADLQASISDSRIQIINTGNELVVRMPNDVLFGVDSSSVGPALQSDLSALAGNLQRYPGSTVAIIGHTDNTGSAAHNQGLSERRASSVANILIGAGVPAGRLQTIGRGENSPIATNLTAEGRAQNRRVDIVIVPAA